jgi:hypothetical protein
MCTRISRTQSPDTRIGPWENLAQAHSSRQKSQELDKKIFYVFVTFFEDIILPFLLWSHSILLFYSIKLISVLCIIYILYINIFRNVAPERTAPLCDRIFSFFSVGRHVRFKNLHVSWASPLTRIIKCIIHSRTLPILKWARILL